MSVTAAGTQSSHQAFAQGGISSQQTAEQFNNAGASKNNTTSPSGSAGGNASSPSDYFENDGNSFGVTAVVDGLDAFPPAEPEGDVVLFFDAPALLNCSLFVGLIRLVQMPDVRTVCQLLLLTKAEIQRLQSLLLDTIFSVHSYALLKKGTV